MEQLTRGQILSFNVPDAFDHENERRRFMLITENDFVYHLIYANNECRCKDGWIKFPDFVTNPVTKEKISEALTKYYGEKFDPQTLIIE